MEKYKNEIESFIMHISQVVNNQYDKDMNIHSLLTYFSLLPFEINVKEISFEKWNSIIKDNIIHSIFGSCVKDYSNHIYIKINVLVPPKEYFNDWNFKIKKSKIFKIHLIFTYLHEVFHIILKHLDNYIQNQFKNILNKYSILSEEVGKFLINYACDLIVNKFLIDSSMYNSDFRKLTTYMVYDRSCSNNVYNELENLCILYIENRLKYNHEKIDDKTSYFKFDNIHKKFIIYDIEDDFKGIVQDIDEPLITSIRNNIINNIKNQGDLNFPKLIELGLPIEIKVDWVKILKTKINRIVNYYTDNSYITWHKLKNKFRHICKIPSQIYIDIDNIAIIAIDNSASMENISLRKINYIIKFLKQYGFKLTILYHDVLIVKEINNENFDIAKLNFRYSDGGTSHKDVFRYIEKHKNDNTIAIIFSDMYSDIQLYIDNYDIKDIPLYFINTDDMHDFKLSNYKGLYCIINLENGKVVDGVL